MPASHRGYKRLSSIVARVEGYRTDGDTAMARLGRTLHLGHWVGAEDSKNMGRSSGLVGIVAREFELAGYVVERKQVPTDNGGPPQTFYKLTGERRDISAEIEADEEVYRARVESRRGAREEGMSRARAARAARAQSRLPVDPRELPPEPRRARRGHPVTPEVEQVIPHPALGTHLQVKVLALTDDAGLVLHLANGHEVWQVQVLGHAPR